MKHAPPKQNGVNKAADNASADDEPEITEPQAEPASKEEVGALRAHVEMLCAKLDAPASSSAPPKYTTSKMN